MAIATAFHRNAASGDPPEAIWPWPDDIADTVLFLASDQAGHVTMQQIVIDGGATLAA